MADVDLANVVTLLDLAQETKNGQFIERAKILTKKLPVFKDAHWEESLMEAAHVFGRDAALASGDYRDINDGIASTTGKSDQVVEPIALYQDRGVIDEELVRLAAPNQLKFRGRKDDEHIRGGANWLGDKFLYGSRATNVNGVDGFCTRYNLLALENVENCGDSSAGAVASALILGWGPEKCFFTHPKGGVDKFLKSQDEGRQMVTGANSKEFWAWVTEFYFRWGICVFNENYVQRLANIGTSSANNVDIDKLIILANNMPDTESAVLYCNKLVYGQLEIAAKTFGDHILQWVKIDDKAFVLYFKGMPVRKWDSMKNTEAVVT